jgi:hypothetical protein
MRAQIAGVEEASAFRFDLQSVRIKSRMIDEMWRDCERANLQGRSAFKIFRGL